MNTNPMVIRTAKLPMWISLGKYTPTRNVYHIYGKQLDAYSQGYASFYFNVALYQFKHYFQYRRLWLHKPIISHATIIEHLQFEQSGDYYE